MEPPLAHPGAQSANPNVPIPPARTTAGSGGGRRGAGPDASEDGGAQPNAGSRGATVLIVEDNDLNMRYFNDLLTYKGYETLQTRDPYEALKIATEQVPDLVLMDIQLGSVSGLDVAKWIKRDDAIKHIPIIAVTAFAQKDDEAMILSNGCDGWLAKPIASATLLETVERYLGRKLQAD